MRFIEDSGHGWLEVSLSEYPNAVDFGTGFGFLDMQKGFIYLEEDMEAYAFCDWLFNGEVTRAREIQHEFFEGDCWVRNLPKNKALLKV